MKDKADPEIVQQAIATWEEWEAHVEKMQIDRSRTDLEFDRDAWIESTIHDLYAERDWKEWGTREKDLGARARRCVDLSDWFTVYVKDLAVYWKARVDGKEYGGGTGFHKSDEEIQRRSLHILIIQASQTLAKLHAKFAPSQVKMFSRSFFPFIDTFKNTEAEIAAGMMVAAMVFHGNEWKALLPQQVGEWLEWIKSSRKDPWWELLNNPIARPDFDRLIADGFTRFVGDEAEERKRPIELTEKAFDRIREKGWVQA